MVRAHFLHPAHSSPTENIESSERDVELIAVAKSVCDQPVIVAGDSMMLLGPRQPSFRKISIIRS
jgi:hypothetical protein